MKQITAEGVNYIYYPFDIKQEELADLLSAMEGYSILTEEIWHTVVKPEMEASRFVKIKISHDPPWHSPHFLHWDDGLDLLGLDRRVHDNTYTDSDFENSLYTDFIGIECRKCKWRRYALSMDFGMVYPIRGLGKEKIKRRSKQGGMILDQCPSCGTNLRRTLIKVFSVVPPPDAEG